ncbi:hypothetical protein [Microtetraspora sp. NBRC 16547]|uniref:hypothetical protein n=1 Tax=Microtetraspora sp. NBRC 16547 TaxID=3030993 RepID=UPI0024A3D6D2|nr:hypothetical protein [Microtetraspora sp. NBRC 16547]GLW98600.1 hypothetical protein Misp02_26870 [Microtetraspora sp. NBRC 16547]
MPCTTAPATAAKAASPERNYHGAPEQPPAAAQRHSRTASRRASPEQRLPYPLLPEAEKEKDRLVVRLAVELWS